MNDISTGLTIPASGSDKHRKWFERLAAGMAVRRYESDDWKKNEAVAYKRPEAHENKDTRDQTAINKLGAWCEKRMASLAFRDPGVKIRPKKENAWKSYPFPVFDEQGGPVMDPVLDPMGMPVIDPMTGMPAQQQRMGYVPRYKILEATMNHIIGHPNFEFAAEIRRFIRASLLALGVAKVGYTAHFKYVDEETPPLPADDMVFMDPEKLQEDYLFDEGVPVIVDGMLVPKDQVPIEEQWFFHWVPYTKMIFDPDGGNRFLDHKWVACEYDMPLEEVKKDKRLKNTKNLRGTGEKMEREHEIAWDAPLDERGYRDHKGRKKEKTVKLFEIWDFVDKRWMILADGHDKPLLDEEFPAGVDRSTGPWVFYRPIERIDEWYPDAMATWLRTIAENYDKFNEQALREGRKSARKVLFRTSKIDEVQKEDLIDPFDRAIGIDDDDISLDQVAFSFEVGGVNPGTMALKNDLNRDFVEVGGSPDSASGIASADTATEAKALMAYDTLREDYQRAILRLSLIDAMRKLKNSIQANATIAQYVTINGDGGQVMAGDVTYDMLECDCDVDIDIDDLKPQNDQQLQMNMEKAMVAASQAPWLVMNRETATAFFEIYGIKDERIVNGIVQGAQMQMQMMMAPKQPEKPTSGPATSESDAISKQGGAL